MAINYPQHNHPGPGPHQPTGYPDPSAYQPAPPPQAWQGPPVPYGAYPQYPQYPHYPPPPPPRGKGKTLVWVAAAVVVLGGLIAGGTAVALREARRNRLPPREESVEKKYEEATTAFGTAGPTGANLPPQTDGQRRQEITALFDQVGPALSSGNPASVLNLFDTDRMYTEVERAGMVPASPASRRREHSEAFTAGLRSGVGKFAAAMTWERYEIKHIRPLDSAGGADEAVVYLRAWMPQGHAMKMRWWVRRGPAGWRVYDFETLDTGMRVTSLTGLSKLSPAGMAQVQQAVSALRDAGTKLLDADIDGAEAALQGVQNLTLPPMIGALREVQWSAVRIRQKRFPEALTHADKALSLKSDLPVAKLLRASALVGLSRHDEALGEVAAYEQALGAEDTAYFVRGDALFGLGKKAEAAAAYRQGLADNAESADNLAGLCKVLAPGAGRVKELAGHLGKSADASALFVAAAGEAVGRNDADGAADFIAAYRTAGANDPWLDYYRAEEKILRREYRQAIEIFDALKPRVPAEMKELFDDEYKAVREALDGGKGTGE